MAKLKTLATAASAAAVAAQTGVSTTDTPFAPGHNAIAHIELTAVTGTPTILIQTSPDNSVWTTVATMNVLTRFGFKAEFILDKWVRSNMTVAGGAGNFDVYVTA